MLAIGMHDCGWIDDDASPTFDADAGLPFDFIRMPLDRRLEIYRRSIDEVERLGERAGLLVSIHFSGFVAATDATEFCASEQLRKDLLRTKLGADADSVDADYAILKALDHLSLIACVATPGSDPDSHPRWAGDSARLAGVATHISWKDDRTVALRPSPFEEPCLVSLPFVDVDRHAIRCDATLGDAIRAADRCTLDVTFVPA
jgi:hypothetical protein